MINILLQVLGTLVCIFLCAIFYRAGGMDKKEKNPEARPTWIPNFLRASWVRDWGCPAPALGILAMWSGVSFLNYMMLVSYALMGAALSTYKYWLPKPPDYLWYHYALHGFFTSFACIPLALAGFSWKAILISTAVNTVAMSAWSHFTTKDYIEEPGRGGILAATRLLMFLPIK